MYKQLTLAQRITIEEMYAQGARQSAIAAKVGVHRSTVKRELDRNSEQGEYKARQAHIATVCRKQMVGFVAQLFKFRKKGESLGLPVAKINNTSTHRRIYNSRVRSRKRQFRLKRYLLYTSRPDLRPYKMHPNKRRKPSYRRWQRHYEKNYRFRDNARAERNRMPRSRKDFLAYALEIKSAASFFHRKNHLALRRWRRKRFELLRNRYERDIRDWEYELFRIKNKEEIEELEAQVVRESALAEKNEFIRTSDRQIAEQEPAALFYVYLSPDLVFKRRFYRRSGFT